MTCSIDLSKHVRVCARTRVHTRTCFSFVYPSVSSFSWTSDNRIMKPLGINFSDISIRIQTFSFKKIRLKVSSAKWRSFCLGLNVLIDSIHSHIKGRKLEQLLVNDDQSILVISWSRYIAASLDSNELTAVILWAHQRWPTASNGHFSIRPLIPCNHWYLRLGTWDRRLSAGNI